MFTYLPLYAEEVLGFGDQAAGWAVSLMGLVGIGARIAWGRAAELRLGSPPSSSYSWSFTSESSESSGVGGTSSLGMVKPRLLKLHLYRILIIFCY